MTFDGLETLAFLIALILAITFHEAAHGLVARLFGDYTAARLGRVTLNPLKHIDPLGTIILPGFMLISGAPFLFGYAKPVPVNTDHLHPQRWGKILVAAAGPGMKPGCRNGTFWCCDRSKVRRFWRPRLGGAGASGG
jgi:Zn-dependent protease